MSEPSKQLDLTALQDALGDDEQAAAPYSLGGDEAAAPAPAKAAEQPAVVVKESSKSSSTPAATTEPVTPALTGDPQVDNIRAMFPDFDVETVRTVLAHNGGDMEGAVNALLSMSDPTYVAPPPATAPATLENDALLAASLAEQDRQRYAAHHQQQQQQQQAPAVERPFFEGTGATYDPAQLTYAPRIRRNPPSATARAAFHAPPPAGSVEGVAPNQPMRPGWPGPDDAQKWSEQINKAAETGLSKAASTFSALRQRVAQASAPAEGGSPSSGSNNASSRGGGGAASFFAPLVSGVRQATGAATGNSSGGPSNVPSRTSSTGYDRDPAPVGNAELAALLARGSAPPSKADKILGTRAQTGAFEDRYGSTTTAPSSARGAKPTMAATEEEEAELGWGDVGRAPVKSSTKTKIDINDNTKGAASTAATSTTAPKDSVSRMDAAAGRGIVSPTPGSTGKGVGLAAGAGAAAGVGTGAALASHDAPDEDDDDDGGSDLEYVSNPFENDD